MPLDDFLDALFFFGDPHKEELFEPQTPSDDFLDDFFFFGVDPSEELQMLGGDFLVLLFLELFLGVPRVVVPSPNGPVPTLSSTNLSPCRLLASFCRCDSFELPDFNVGSFFFSCEPVSFCSLIVMPLAGSFYIVSGEFPFCFDLPLCPLSLLLILSVYLSPAFLEYISKTQFRYNGHLSTILLCSATSELVGS